MQSRAMRELDTLRELRLYGSIRVYMARGLGAELVENAVLDQPLREAKTLELRL